MKPSIPTPVKNLITESLRQEIVLVHVNHYLLRLSMDAAEVLLGYLKVIKAYFMPLKQFGYLSNQFYEEIGVQLSQYREIIQIGEISLLIQTLGSISDWERRGFKVASTFFRMKRK